MIELNTTPKNICCWCSKELETKQERENGECNDYCEREKQPW